MPLARLLLVVAFLVGLAAPAQASNEVPLAVATAATCASKLGPGIPPPAAPSAKQPGFHAAWWGQSGYMQLCPGDKATATVAYYNTGSSGWVAGKMGEVAYLGTWGPEPGQDRASFLGGDGAETSPPTGWPRYNRPAIQPAPYVGPGQIAWFQFTVQAPSKPGIYFLGLRPLVEGGTWMEDSGVFWLVTVLNPDGTPPPFACLQCWPLSGMPTNGGDVSRRPISVKIDNVIPARPHYGIGLADMVWETLVEGYVTRLDAVFHSQDPATIGAVRSGRLFDRYLTPSIRGALAYSGATIEELAAFRDDVAAGKYVDVGAATGAGNSYYRVDFRAVPYNLFTSSKALRDALAAQGKAGGVTVPRWDFSLPVLDLPLDQTGMNGSVAATALTIPYRAGVTVRYQYDAGTRTYARWQNEVREVDAANDQAVAVRNVIVIGTEVFNASPPIVEDSFGSLGLDMRTTGTGPASIFRDGRRQDGTWARETIFDPWFFTNQQGQRILLSPGQTWVHVVPKDWTISSSQ